MNGGTRNKGVLQTVVRSLIPYTEENLQLAYRPNMFFDRLEYVARLSEQTGSSKQTIRITLNRARRAGLISLDAAGSPHVTWRGRIKAKVLPERPMRHWLVIVFDIPEHERENRDMFRDYLSSVRCEYIQKSVWKTKYDIVDELQDAISDLGIGKFVNLFLADDF